MTIDNDIRFILLDLDGTLLDRHFDDYFWEHLLPEIFAERNGITFAEAHTELLSRFKHEEGNLRWTDLDYWSDNLGIDIPALKFQMRHLIEVHPHVREFLGEMRRQGKTIALVTNAHFKALDVKLEKTELHGCFDLVAPSLDLGAAKEDIAFWQRLEGRLGADYREHSILVDDTEAVLRTARLYGIRRVVFKAGANSSRPVKHSEEFESIESFRELIPE